MKFIGWIGEDDWIGDIVPDPFDDDYILYQTGEVLLLQDDTGLLEEQA